ncbi:5-formyltetrahydrofolate cyclo-ligase [Radiobacillus deserti]|uniref:5-formyltetrahydrofolate cyclo-ligase n=1 Tax=Radiobacillus deserti TaxID=2594883 RepID=A0A516KGT6_9BACI|nr:5-formyltetrahydrofolate cyclo-ligase [Radiobacillus deserti]QDP40611.1 5-formyltetrahydrofolate cyclo-ligase [Radiobacillus deserti]
MDKRSLRLEAKRRLGNMSEEQRKDVQAQLETNLIQSTLWKSASCVGITISYGLEWNTNSVIEKAWDCHKTVSVPKVNPADSSMAFYRITSFQDLEEGYKGILEPKSSCVFIPKDNLDLLIVPGLLFDKDHHRLGYGGGFYDRFLQDYMGKTIALAAEAQLYQGIPSDTYDIPIQHLITEVGFRY